MNKNFLFLGIAVIMIISISGCTSISPESLALANPLVDQFMEEYPNAEVQVTHFTTEQSEQIIEDIRADCGNPFMEAQDFYKITIVDSESGLDVVAWVNWETKDIECAIKKGTETKEISKPGEDIKECEIHKEVKCHGDHVYWVDSCGNIEEKKEYCKNGCEEGKCKEQAQCQVHHTYKCHGDHVYWFDSCGNKEDKKEYCENGCEDGACKEKENCKEAGQIAFNNPTGSYTACCAGLDEVPNIGDGTPEQCEAWESMEGYGTMCTDCGNGECESWENRCRCPEDCKEASFCGSSTYHECEADLDCASAGCSSQVCAGVGEEVTTTCEYLDCYNAANYGLECGCVKNKCMWREEDTGCTDTDGGKNYFEKGTTTTGSISMTDHCNDEGKSLTEKYCSNGNIAAEKVSCTCEDAVCLDEPSEYDPYGDLTTCTDTDGGLQYYTKGETLGYKPGTTTVMDVADECKTETILTEYKCSGVFVKSVDISCSSGCESGACISAPEKTAQENCEDQYGMWGEWPDDEAGETCNHKTTDAGDVCIDSDDCDSVCEAPEETEEGANVVGSCYTYNYLLVDCVQTIEDGFATAPCA